MSIKAVVVGAGGISDAWFPHLKEEGVDVGGIVDLDCTRAKAQASKFGIAPFISADMKDMLNQVKPDFVVDLDQITAA